ncbi:NmrA/HSCARG family protein [Actinospica robiniae]|uniref:NmrA/HSCARG family protein n=1 Tax=Actinospica robiniae TaxID=304901 RepID=UPI000410A661|nr:NmrA/HSCARG family protein [Actinospica robiniae]
MATTDPVFVPLDQSAYASPGAGRIVLVTGATGNQGGAAARHLLGGGWQVRALVRDPDTAAARVLAELGAHLVVGDMSDLGSLARAAEGAYGVFSVQPVFPADPDEAAAKEVAMGVNVAQAARTAGVRHFVYASVGGADREPEPWHWKTKARIEARIRGLGLPNTILRPVMFMENHASRGPYGATVEAALIRAIAPGARVQLIAVTDIGAFAALAFADPDRFLGRELELAGAEPTRERLAAAIGSALGRPLDLSPLEPAIARRYGIDLDRVGSAEFGGWQADIPALRALHPGLLDFESWLAAGGSAKFRA